MFRKSLTLLSAAAILMPVCSAFANVQAGLDAWGRGAFETAIALWRPLALKGDADAQFNMGQAYRWGRGVKSDINVALDWYQRAARQGHLQAADNVGHILHFQNRIPEAMTYLNTSAMRGEPRAQYLYATELFNGVHIKKDWVRAYAFMTRASSSGLAHASRSLAQMDKYIPLEQRQQATVMAGRLEEQASQVRSQQTSGFPIDTRPQQAVAASVDLPTAPGPIQSYPGEQSFPGDDTVPEMPTAVSTRPVQTIPASRPVGVRVPPAVKTVATNNGAWRIQLGAFGSEANARNLWSDLEVRVTGLAALQPYLNAKGNITRLQAGPFTTRAAAEAMCKEVQVAGQACIAVPKQPM